MGNSSQNKVFGIATLLIIVPILLGSQLPLGFDKVIFLASLILFGIPHGAIDHIIYQHSKAESNNISKSGLSFYVPYILILITTIGFWLLIPALMFWIFLLISAYHFGQSQLYYIKLPEKNFQKWTLYLVWGIFILSNLWFYNWEALQPIILTLFDWNLNFDSFLYFTIKHLSYSSGFSVLILLFYTALDNELKWYMFLQELIVLIILYTLIRTTSVYLSFGIYFGIWHALRVIITEYKHLNHNPTKQVSFKAFCISFIPFSVLSFAGIGLLLLFNYFFHEKISNFMLFLIAISALTMPHALVMQGMYKLLVQPKLSKS